MYKIIVLLLLMTTTAVFAQKINAADYAAENIPTAPDAVKPMSPFDVNIHESDSPASVEKNNKPFEQPVIITEPEKKPAVEEIKPEVVKKEEPAKIEPVKEDLVKANNTDSTRNTMFELGISPCILGGLYMPVSDYASRYESTVGYGLGALLPRFTFFGLIPNVEMRYMEMKTKHDNRFYDAVLDRTDIFAGFVYSYKLSSGFLPEKITAYGKLNAGVSYVSIITKKDNKNVGENVAAFLAGAGVTYPVGKVDVGLEGAYEYIATAGTPLQSVQVSLVCGVRL